MEKQWNQWVNSAFSGITWPAVLIAVATFAAIWLLLILIHRFAKQWLPRWARHCDHELDAFIASLLKAVRPGLFPLFAFYGGLASTNLQPQARSTLAFAAATAFVFQLMLFANRTIDYLFARYSARHAEGHVPTTAKSNLMVSAKVVTWLLAVLLLLDNFGINVTTFVAGLGIGGIAVALAAQAVLGDTFGSFTITLDKPFVPGDYISFGADEGRVETIGLKTTRIRGLGGEIIVVPNSELTRARLKNFADMQERRGVLRQPISDRTSLATLEILPDLIKETLSPIDGVRVSRTHLVGTAPQAFILEIEWFSEGSAYIDFLNRQQQLYLTLYRLMIDSKIYGPAPEKLLITPDAMQHSMELH